MKSTSIIALFIFGFTTTTGKENPASISKDQAKHLLIYEERPVSALRLLTKELNYNAAHFNDIELSENIYWIAECLLQLKKNSNLETIYIKCSNYVEQHNPEAGIKLQIVYGKYLIEMGKYNECVLLMTKLRNEVADNTIRCEIHLTLADALMRLQNAEESRRNFEVVITHSNDSIQTGRAYNGIGSYFCIQTEMDSAKRYYNIAYTLLLKVVGPDHSRTAQVVYNLGLVADREVDYYTAENNFKYALKVYLNRLGTMHPRTAQAYGALGSLYLMEDNPEKALHYSLKEKSILQKIYGQEHPDLVYSFLNLGKIYYLLNNYNLSEQYLKAAIDVIKKEFGLEHNLYKQCIVELSKIWIYQKNHAATRSMLQVAMKISEDEYSGDLYLQSGENYLSEHKYEEAIHEFTVANELYSKFYGEKNIYSTDALLGLSNAYLKMQNHQDAYKMANKAIAMTTKGNQIIYPYDNWVCMLQLLTCKKAMYEQLTPDTKTIIADIKQIRKAIAVANTIRHTLYTPGSQAYFTERMSVLNKTGIYFLTNWYKNRDVYFYNHLIYFSENDKANLLRGKIINYESNEILPAAEKNMASYITGRYHYFNALLEDIDKPLHSINDSVLYYHNQYESFTKHIEQKYPKIHYLKYGNKNISIDRIQEELKDNFSLLEYFNDDENYYCISISNYDVKFKECGKLNYIDSLIHVFQTAIAQKQYDQKTSGILSECLLPKGLRENLIISPAKSISHVSFDALQQKNNYLLLNHTTQYAFSASTYFLNRSKVHKQNILAVFPDYKGSAFASLNTIQEKNIINTFSEYEILENIAIDKETLIKKSIQAGIIHFGAHLIIDTLIPMHSMLVLQPKMKTQLSLNDVWKLDLNAQLVTLAACQSNFGKQQNGEGIKNFAWAFHYAGARNILSTQWNASDKSTAAIISDFYRELKSGKTKERSLQLAKLNYMKSTDAIGAAPYFWSNFYLYGDETDISVAPDILVKFWWMPIILLLLCYLAFILFRNLFRVKINEHL